MPVEFLGIAATNDGSEIHRALRAAFDKDYTLRLARAHEENGWDRVLFAYGSGAPDPTIGAAYIASKTETLQLLLAHRPNVSYPTFAAKTFATLDQISGGRPTVHFITGGNDHEQQREGDYLTKDERYEPHPRVHGDRQAGVDVAGAVRPRRQALQVRRLRQRRLPRAAAPPRVSFGGSSPAAYAAGGAEADIYCLWGEPLASTAEQIESVRRAAKEAGRTDLPKIQVAFRPIIAPTEEQAWEKAHDIVERIEARVAGERRRPHPAPPGHEPGEHRVAAADRDRRGGRAVRPGALDPDGGRHRRRGQLQRAGRHPGDRRAAILDYIDLGVDIISMRGYDLLADAIDVGQQVIPIVREEVAKRDAALPH